MRIISLVVLFLCVACRPQTEEAAMRTVTDDLGRTVTIPAEVSRVVTLAPSLTEMVFAAGAGDRMVGAATVDTYPLAVDSLPRYGLFPIDYEAITALNPDLVLATTQVNAPRDADTFAALGIPTLFYAAASLDDVLSTLEQLGDVFGTTEIATATADSLRRAIADLKAATDNLTSRPEVLFLIGDDQLFAFGQGNYIHDLVDLAGGTSITQTIENTAPVLSESYVLEARPEVILGAFGTDYDPATLLERHPTWDIIPAVVDGRVYGLHPDVVLRPGPRLVAAAYQMAAFLHPSLAASLPADRRAAATPPPSQP